jgi:hypothetical protein
VIKSSPDQVIKSYLEMFAKANPNRPLPIVTYENGWYSFQNIGAKFKYREHNLKEFEKELSKRIPIETVH